MKYIILLWWAMTVSPDTQDNYYRKNLFAATICQDVFGVPVSIQFSQAIWECGGGKSYISKNSNNHFGMKWYKNAPMLCSGYFEDRSGCKYRAYPSVFISYLDHSYFVWRYYRKNCYGSYLRFKTAKGYGGAGYWSRVIKLIESQNLSKYDGNFYRGRPSL